MEADTESLRSTAPQWSLAGDQQLLGVLQNIHERLVSRCQETNRRLGEMAAALDDASVDLQNVNNKFMALSNSQFIESRVYEDDADVAPAEAKAEPQTPLESISEVDQIKIGLKVLEDMHEPLTILDSDSESDSDEETTRMVLKPKDLYEDRPLPYIIGSYAWQSKWHAGLLAEDSDTDSSVKREPWEREEYSESDTEISKPAKEQESSCSSEISSHLSTSQPDKPANIADQIAKRLGQRPEPENQPEEYSPPAPTVNKVYRPEQPAISNIFSDEPPPLEHSYQSDDNNDEDDDIFAELRKNQPYAQSNRAQSNVTDELFGKKQNVDIFSNFAQPPPPASQKSTLFTEEQEPELFAEQPPPLPKSDTVSSESNVKKPIGGISVFGNKGTESIGAAILQRNRRQSSTDEDISEDTSQKQEKDIFDHLFAKSEKENRKADKKVKENIEKEMVKEVKVDKKVDLFSDNLFDDIDDIFTSNIPKVPIKTAEKNQKSLFDDDDLFSEVAVAKNKNVKDTKDNKKSIFDSDDDLFSEKVEKNILSKETGKSKGKNESKKEIVENKKNIFDSDDDLFTDKKEQAPSTQSSENNKSSEIKKNSKKEEIVKNVINKSIFDSDDDMFTNKTDNIPGTVQNKQHNKNHKTNSMFDDDADIFSENVNTKPKEVFVNSIVEERKIMPDPVLETKKTSSIFDDDEEDLFKSESNSKEAIKKSNEDPTVNTKPSSSLITNISEKQTESTFVDGFDTKSEVRNNTLDSSKDNKIGQHLKKSLFDDESEDELFSDKPKQVISEPKTDTKSIESSKKAVEDDDDLFRETSLQTRDQTLKTEIKDEILEEIKDELKNEIKDEVISELKDDLVVVKNDQVVTNAETRKPVNKSKLDDIEKDFEDSSPKDTLSRGDIDITETSKKSSIFDEVENDLFSNSSKSIESQVNKDKTSIENPKLQEVDTRFDVPKPEKPVSKGNSIHEEPPLLYEPKESLFDTQDEFSDIFIEPPKFEKPKEPKKSKNINALFDDDSDDEALFFRKDDPTLDEKPEFESPTTENRIFGIFQDEPPDLDIDFVQKSNDKTKKEPSTVLDTRNDGIKASKDQTDSNLISKSQDRAELNNEIPHSIESQGNSSKITKDSDNAPKSIGKLKSMNFNINVNALLPGASPKKAKVTEQIDGNTQAKSSEDISTKNAPELESKMVKSISFEGKPDSPVLDNTVSKERARIQVKRRPSTRRARKEAVRKSGIDFGDDSTDNSSSIDDQPKATKRSENIDDKSMADVPLTRSDDDDILQSTEKVIEIPKDDEKTVEVDKDFENTIDTDKKLFKSENKSKIDTEVKHSGNESEQNTENSSTKDILQKPEVTTKTVYILNDEDIFSVEKPKKVLNIIDDDIPSVSTLGNVYKESKDNSDSGDDLFRNVNKKSELKDITDSGDKLFKSETATKPIVVSNEKLFTPKEKEAKNLTKSIFDDESEKDDENLFKPEPKGDIKKENKSIFDLSDDEDLFSKDKDVSNEMFKKEVKKVEVKTSLFDDEDDDDNLFGSSRSKKTSEPTSSQAHRTKDIVSKSSEPVFEDPLSLFGEDDD